MTVNQEWAPSHGRSRIRIVVLGSAASLVLIGIGVAAAFRDFAVWYVPIILGAVGLAVWAVAVPAAHRHHRL